MTRDEAKQAIYNFFVTEWAGETPVTIENEDFDPAVEGGTEWVRLSMRDRQANQRTLGRVGNRRFERPATLFVQVFTRKGQGGTQRSDQLAHLARSILEGTNQVSGIWFFVATIGDMIPEDYWNMVVVEVEISYDETK